MNQENLSVPVELEGLKVLSPGIVKVKSQDGTITEFPLNRYLLTAAWGEEDHAPTMYSQKDTWVKKGPVVKSETGEYFQLNVQTADILPKSVGEYIRYIQALEKLDATLALQMIQEQERDRLAKSICSREHRKASRLIQQTLDKGSAEKAEKQVSVKKRTRGIAV